MIKPFLALSYFYWLNQINFRCKSSLIIICSRTINSTYIMSNFIINLNFISTRIIIIFISMLGLSIILGVCFGETTAGTFCLTSRVVSPSLRIEIYFNIVLAISLFFCPNPKISSDDLESLSSLSIAFLLFL